jgi:hypothetical protein
VGFYDKQADRQTDRQAERQTDRHTLTYTLDINIDMPTHVNVIMLVIIIRFAIACFRNTRTKSKPQYIKNKNILDSLMSKRFYMICTIMLIPDVDTAWDYFYMKCVSICDKHAPVKKCRISGRDNQSIKSNVFIKPFLHQLISQSAVQEPSLKLQTASNAGVEARWLGKTP